MTTVPALEPLPPSAPPPEATFADFTIVERLADDELCERFLARRDGISGFQRHVEIKRLRAQFVAEPRLVQTFLEEARIAAALTHPNIVQVLEVGERQGEPYCAMETVEGETLAAVLAAAGAAGRPLDLAAALAIATGVCAGLHHLHEYRGTGARDLVHRDVSARNVFVTREGAVKLRISGATRAGGRARTVSGDAAYASPELAFDEHINRRSDVFAVGILLWEATTGQPLYHRRTEAATLRALHEPAPRPSTIVAGYPEELEDIVLACLARDPAQRWTTAESLSRALEAFARAHGLLLSPRLVAREMAALFAPAPTAVVSPVFAPRGRAPLDVADAEDTADAAEDAIAALALSIAFEPTVPSARRLACGTGQIEPSALAADAPPLDPRPRPAWTRWWPALVLVVLAAATGMIVAISGDDVPVPPTSASGGEPTHTALPALPPAPTVVAPTHAAPPPAVSVLAPAPPRAAVDPARRPHTLPAPVLPERSAVAMLAVPDTARSTAPVTAAPTSPAAALEPVARKRSRHSSHRGGRHRDHGREVPQEPAPPASDASAAPSAAPRTGPVNPFAEEASADRAGPVNPFVVAPSGSTPLGPGGATTANPAP